MSDYSGKDYDGFEFIERRICIGLITRGKYLERVQPFAEDLERLLATKWSRLVCGWVLEYYQRYGRPPKANIEAIYEAHKEELDPDTQDEIRLFLKGLSGEYKNMYRESRSINIKQLTDQTKDYLCDRHSEVHDEKIAELTEGGETQKAEELRQNYSPLNLDDESDPDFVLATEVRSKALEWLWRDRIPLGETTMLLGDPDQGKSTVALDIAARVTTGRDWPIRHEGRARQGKVLILTAEDKWEHTVKPRLLAAGADVKHIIFFPAVVKRRDAKTGQPYYKAWSVRDTNRLRRVLDKFPDIRFFIIDPLAAFMGGKNTDTHKNTDVREALLPLEALVGERRLSLLVIHHPSKSEQKAIYRASGSVAFAAMPRAAFAVGKNDQDDPDRYLIARLKHNLTADTTGMAYRIHSCQITLDDGKDADLPVIEWENAPVDITAEELMSPPKDPSKMQIAKEWLMAEFADGRSRDVDEIRKKADREGIKMGTLHSARKSLHIETIGRGRGSVMWVPPKKPNILTFLRHPRTMSEIGPWARKNVVGMTPPEVKHFVRELVKAGSIIQDNSGDQLTYTWRDEGSKSDLGNVVSISRKMKRTRHKE